MFIGDSFRNYEMPPVSKWSSVDKVKYGARQSVDEPATVSSPLRVGKCWRQLFHVLFDEHTLPTETHNRAHIRHRFYRDLINITYVNVFLSSVKIILTYKIKIYHLSATFQRLSVSIRFSPGGFNLLDYDEDDEGQETKRDQSQAVLKQHGKHQRQPHRTDALQTCADALTCCLETKIRWI